MIIGEGIDVYRFPSLSGDIIQTPQPPSPRPGRTPPDVERFLHQIFDTMFEGVQILDSEWRYVYLNATAAAQGRQSREALLGRRIMDVYPDIDATPMFELLRRCMKERVPQNMVNEFVYPDGSIAWFDLRMDPVPMGVLILSIDITAAKAVEEQLREAQKLEAIGRLAGGVAHDFNNLLTVIGGYSDFVLQSMVESDRFREELEEIRYASQRASELTRQLLAFSRRQRLEPRVLDLNAVVERMDKLLQRLIGEQIDLVIRLNPAAGNVYADANQLEQVVLNLAVNARDAMPDGGKLTVQTDAVELDEAYALGHTDAAPGPHVMLAVSDSGSGMDDATKARIFEPFFTTKEQGRGTGLGLATVYGIVKQSGGNIWVYSEPGRGATFKVYLPRVSAAPEQEIADKPVTFTRGSETVLVVEDDDAVRAFIRMVLEAAGYTVVEAADADQALDLAQSHAGAIDLLLTDVVLPGLGGRQLADRILSQQPDMHIVFMSGYTDDAIIHRGGFEGGAPFIDKPIAAAALLLKLREVLDQAHGR